MSAFDEAFFYAFLSASDLTTVVHSSGQFHHRKKKARKQTLHALLVAHTYMHITRYAHMQRTYTRLSNLPDKSKQTIIYSKPFRSFPPKQYSSDKTISFMQATSRKSRKKAQSEGPPYYEYDNDSRVFQSVPFVLTTSPLIFNRINRKGCSNPVIIIILRSRWKQLSLSPWE